MTVDGLDLLVAIICVAALLLLFELWRWDIRNERRKDERLVQRNLRRAGL